MFHTSPKLTSGPPRITSPGRAFFVQARCQCSCRMLPDFPPFYNASCSRTCRVLERCMSSDLREADFRAVSEFFLSIESRGVVHIPRISIKEDFCP